MNSDRLGPEALERLDRLLAALGLAAATVLLVLGLAFVAVYARGGESGGPASGNYTLGCRPSRRHMSP